MAKNIINDKIYVGQTIGSLNDRISKHFYEAFQMKKTYYFYNALRKYGKESFVWGIICECFSEDELNKKEIEVIQKFKSTIRQYGYNIKNGGCGGKHSDETKEKIRIANTGFVHTEESKKK